MQRLHKGPEEGDVVVVQISGGPLDGEVRCFEEEPPEHRWCTNLTEKKGKKYIECYELDSYGVFQPCTDIEHDVPEYINAVECCMKLYYRYVGRREVDEIDEDGSMSIKPIKRRKKKKNK